VSANPNDVAVGQGSSQTGSSPAAVSAGAGTADAPIFRAQNISKSFTGKRVLENLDLEIMPGEVHSLVGQNGSGKSTFIKILAGYHAPDEETDPAIWIRNERVPLPLDPGDRAERGFAFVHQDLGLIETASVLENVRVRNFDQLPGGRISWRRERRHVRQLLERFGLDISPDQQIGQLSQIERTSVAIVRAFDQLAGAERGLLVLDEPTAALPRDGIERFFATVNELTAEGFGVLFVSHRLEEVFELTTRVTVLRDGRRIHTGPTSELNEDRLIEHILGFSLERLYPEPHTPATEVVASVESASAPGVSDVSLKVHKGEILGVTGLLGTGWEQVPYLLFGAASATAGTLQLNGTQIDLKDLTPRKAIALGCALLPGNRLVEGSLQTVSVMQNLTLPTLGSYFSSGFLHHGRERTRAQTLLHEFDVRPPQVDRLLSSLSGGNQQKVLVAKWFETNPKLLMLHEPTHGVDVGARAQIFQRLKDAAANGVGVVVASADYEDLPHICNRVIVFRGGRAVSELYGAELTHERVVEQCFRTT
jgi:ribose transport system ATP-binding protein